MGFEPTQLALVELESTPLDHSGKLSRDLGCQEISWDLSMVMWALVLAASRTILRVLSRIVVGLVDGWSKRKSTARGFEPLRAEPNGFRVHLLSRSDTLSAAEGKTAYHSSIASFCEASPDTGKCVFGA